MVSISDLARRLGISRAAFYLWLEQGLVAPPRFEPVSGKRRYTAAEAERVERWYQQRAATPGGTRGPGAVERRARAEKANETA